MNAKISVFVICVEEIIYLLLYNLHDCTFNVLKVNDVDIEVLCPLFFTCLLNKEKVTDSIKYVINNPNLMRKGIYLFC